MAASRRAIWAIVFTVGLTASLLSSAASALTLTGLVSPNPATVTISPCPSHPGYDCTTTAYTAQVLSAGYNEAFQQAWNAPQPDNYWDPATWTLNWSTEPLNATFNITTYSPYEFSDTLHHYGGAEIRINWDPAPTPEQTDLRWIQAIHDPVFYPSRPYYLDVARLVAPWNKAPVYPYQYADYRFYDAPNRWCVGDQPVTWDAYLYLARVDRTNKISTVYEGIHWGFTVDCVAVPEPASAVGLLVGVAGCALRRRTSWRATSGSE